MNIKIVNLLFILVLFPNFVSAEWKIIDSLTHPDFNFFRFNDIKTNNFKDILIQVDVNLDRPFIYKSNDSGYSWTIRLFSQTRMRSYKLAYPNRNLAIFMCDSGYYFRSTNNGETWIQHYVENRKRIWQIGFWDNKTGLMFQSRDSKAEVRKTTDGGLSWYNINSPEPKYLISTSYLFTLGNGIAYAIEVDNKVDSVYYFHKSTNYGETWLPAYKGPELPPYGNFYFYNENLGFCFGGQELDYTQKGKLIRRTSNGGHTWERVLVVNMNNDPITGVHFSDSLNGIASSITNIFPTSDGGITWKEDTTYNYKRDPRISLI